MKNKKYIKRLEKEIKELTFNLAMCEYYYNKDGTGSYRKNLLIDQINGMQKYLKALVKIYQDEKIKWNLEEYIEKQNRVKCATEQE